MEEHTIGLSGLSLAKQGDGVLLSCAVDAPGLPSELWVSIRGVEASDLLAAYNWAVVALLYPAMLSGADLVVDGAVSRRLFTNINLDLQAALCAYDRRLRRVKLRASVSTERKETGRVGTGFSAGIDSFATLSLYSQGDGLSVTDLCTFNVGALGQPGAAGVGDLFSKACRRTRDYAQANALGAISIDSNLSAFYPAEGFQRMHTLRNAAAALTLEGVLDYYLYSSGHEMHSIGIRAGKDVSIMDPISLPMLSTESLTFMSAGAGLSRAQKTARVAEFSPAYGLLDVCVEPAARRLERDRPNCSRCWKCRRTMVSLDAMGALDRFQRAFDLEHYRTNKDRICDELAVSAIGGNYIDREALTLLGRRAHPPSVLLRGIARRLKGQAKALRR